MTSRSNVRWCSDVLEFTCWNGDLVRVAFALDSHDRKVSSWVATTAGIFGEMIRDMMVQCVKQRFGDLRAPHRVQWLTDMSGSIRFPRPGPRFQGSTIRWSTTTVNTRILAWATAHRGSTLHHFNKPRVRSNEGNSTAVDLSFPLLPDG
jgi:hypothetical protein